ncbi:hypothetical protein [Streptomyces sp. 061-3]|uniref:hypothetical protein n=1 Tax=Streptomyces sp. 061-3 TaxID=2789268 RepID=UPI0039816F14
MANTWNTDNAGVSALAVGDFDGDGHDDLALGECREIADENVDDPCGPEEIAKGGGIHVHYGNATPGSFGFRQQTLNQDTVGVAGVAEAGDRFGAALAVADPLGSRGPPAQACGLLKYSDAATFPDHGPPHSQNSFLFNYPGVVSQVPDQRQPAALILQVTGQARRKDHGIHVCASGCRRSGLCSSRGGRAPRHRRCRLGGDPHDWRPARRRLSLVRRRPPRGLVRSLG